MKKSNKIVHTSGKRKSAVARATIQPGSGKVIINKTPIEIYSPQLSKERIMEPVLLLGDGSKKIDISVTINGGGVSSQADAARVAIGKGLVAFTKDKNVEQMFADYDRQLLVSDVRRKEPAKPNRHGQARAKRQKSYR
ncbi:MAG: 30S ribosomal protein S9 [Candidatus Woesearchaeota archaeon]